MHSFKDAQCRFCDTTFGMALDRKTGYCACGRCLLRVCQFYEAALQKIAAGPQDEPAVDCTGEYEQGLFCGLEDRDWQTDPYGACRYGFDEGVDRVLEWAQGIAESALQTESKETTE